MTPLVHETRTGSVCSPVETSWGQGLCARLTKVVCHHCNAVASVTYPISISLLAANVIRTWQTPRGDASWQTMGTHVRLACRRKEDMRVRNWLSCTSDAMHKRISLAHRRAILFATSMGSVYLVRHVANKNTQPNWIISWPDIRPIARNVPPCYLIPLL